MFTKKTNVLIGISLMVVFLVIFSLFKLEEIKTQNRLKEIEAQKEKEISLVLERERIEQEKEQAKTDFEYIQSLNREDCMLKAEADYEGYIRLNGTDMGDDVFRAPKDTWDTAEKKKATATDLCFKQYPVQ